MRDTAELGIQQIFCSYDNPRGNAETERVMQTVKEECLWLNEFSCFEQAWEAIEKWIREDYNRLYVHSALVSSVQRSSTKDFYQNRFNLISRF